MLYRRWIYILIDIVAHSIAVYSEVSIVLKFMSFLYECSADSYSLTTILLETILMIAAIFLSLFSEYIISRADLLEEKGQKVWERGLLPKI